MRAFLLVLTMVVASAIACSPTPSPRPPSDVTACQHACDVLATMGCPEGMPTKAGESCASVCEATEASGFYSLHPDRVARATTVAEVRAAGVRCLGR